MFNLLKYITLYRRFVKKEAKLVNLKKKKIWNMKNRNIVYAV